MGFIKTLKRKSLKFSNLFSKKLNIKNKKIIITGSNSGIGFAITKELVKNNTLLCLVNKNYDNLKILREKSFEIIQHDFKESKIDNHILDKIKNFSSNIFINCAGDFGSSDQDINSINIQKYQEILNINFFSPLRILMQIFKSHSLEQIVNISSEMGSMTLNTNGGYYYYRGSKALVNSLSKNMSIDLKSMKINVFCIHPGSVKTKMNSGGVISPEFSAQKIINIISENNSKSSGKLIDINQKVLEW